MAPNHKFIVDQAAQENPNLLQTNTFDSIFRFMLIVLPRLAAHDSNWGWLTKAAGEKHFTLPNGTFVGVDAICYRPEEEVIDILTNATDPGSSGTAWQPKERRSHSHWYPVGATPPPPPPSGSTIEELRRQIAVLQAQVQGLQDEVRAGLSLDGRRIALRSVGSGFLVCADGDSSKWDLIDSHGRQVRGIPNRLLQAFDRSNPGAWEEFVILDRGR